MTATTTTTSTTEPTKEPSNKNNNDDDDDDDDEDYIPPNTNENHHDDTIIKSNHDDSTSTNTSIPILSSIKQRAVDDAFADLFGTTTTTAATASTNTNNTKKKKKSKSIQKKKQKILSDIFGSSSIAMSILDKSNNNTNSSNSKTKTNEKKRKMNDTLGGILPSSTLATSTTSTSSAILSSMKKRIITEKKVFAGQTIEIQRTVRMDGGSSSHADDGGEGDGVGGVGNDEKQGQGHKLKATSTIPKLKKPTKIGGIDAVLKQISGGPQKISTIDKTNIDWENFKDKNTGLDDELKKKAESNDAYLVKKDFLQRVDLRRFEQEKDERNRKRAAAQNNSK